MLVTSHYMADISYLCPRVMVIDGGRLNWDGPLSELGRRLEREKLVDVAFSSPSCADGPASKYSPLLRRRDGGRLELAVPRERLASVLSELTGLAPADISVQDLPLEETLAEVFGGGWSAWADI